MAALATVADLEVRLGRSLSSEETVQAAALLDDASANVRTYTGRQFAPTTETKRLRVVRGAVTLPGRPVTAVTTIKNMAGTTLPFTWYAGNRIHVSAWVNSANLNVDDAVYVDVTYTHGDALVPDAIVAVVCSIAKRALEVPGDSSGLSQESMGGYSYSIGPVAASGGSGLLNPEKAVLDRFRRVVGTAWVGST